MLWRCRPKLTSGDLQPTTTVLPGALAYSRIRAITDWDQLSPEHDSYQTKNPHSVPPLVMGICLCNWPDLSRMCYAIPSEGSAFRPYLTHDKSGSGCKLLKQISSVATSSRIQSRGNNV